jgi:N-acetylneuraminic acid mutarotase
MKLFRQAIPSVLLFLAACTGAPQSEVKVLVGPAPRSVVSTLSADAFSPRSSTGLVTTGFCYALNVTAPDLNVDGTSGSASCAQGPRALGKVFGPLAYGAQTTIKVPSGSDRRFDLVGFKAPANTRQDCSGVLSVRAIDGKVEMLYDGVDVGANEWPLDVSRLSYLFARAPSVTLQPGVQSVTLDSVAWSEKDLGQGLLNYPEIYGCPSPSETGVGPERISLAWSYIISAGTLSVAQGSTAQVYVQLKDVDGNTVSGVGLGRLSLAGMLGIGSVSAFSELGDGVYLAQISVSGSATLGTRSLIAKIDGESFLSPSLSLQVIAPSAVDFATSTLSVVAATSAGESVGIIVNLMDAGDNPVSGLNPQMRVDIGGDWHPSYGIFLTLTETATGVYQGSFQPLKEGTHDISIDVAGGTLQQVASLIVSPGVADEINISGLSGTVLSELPSVITVETKKNGQRIDAIVPSLNLNPVGSATATFISPTWTNTAVGLHTLTLNMLGRGQFSFKLGGNSGNVYSNTLNSRAILQMGYDPLSQDWNPIEAQYDLAVVDHTAVWTGSEMIVWGGIDTRGTPSPGDDVPFAGLRYWAEDDVWMSVSTPPSGFEYRRDHTAVWTGSKMIIWGGQSIDGSTYYADGAAYDPVSDTWTTLESTNAPSARAQHTAVWTGTQMIVWGGLDSSTFIGEGYTYEPSAGSGLKWQQMSPTNEPSARVTTAVWSGTDFFVFGGYNSGGPQQDGAFYNPGTNTWFSRASLSSPLNFHSLVWAGAHLLRVGGVDSFSTVDSAAFYDVSGDTWTDIAPYPLGFRSNHTSVYVAGSEYVLVWGGQDSGGSPTNSGYVYDANNNTWAWSINATSGVPTPRVGHTAVWTQGAGTRMIVWGGAPP